MAKLNSVSCVSLSEHKFSPYNKQNTGEPLPTGSKGVWCQPSLESPKVRLLFPSLKGELLWQHKGNLHNIGQVVLMLISISTQLHWDEVYVVCCIPMRSYSSFTEFYRFLMGI